MPTVTVVTIPNVPIMEAGENWRLSTGMTTFTTDDLAAAVAAQDDPAKRTPVLKIGHTDPRFDGQPTIGRIENLRVENNGQTLVGDFVGVPKWLADVMPYAYPQRSIEGAWNFPTTTGRVHPFALTGVALLGETDPGIETLDDLKALFYGLPEVEVDGVNASKVPILVQASKEVEMPTMRQANAAVEVEDVRRSYYETLEADGKWSWWIRAIRLDPTDLIVDDDSGNIYRVPYKVSSKGEVTFDDPVKVFIEYQDAEVAASKGGRAVVYSTPQASGRGTITDNPKEGTQVDLSILRQKLGMDETATDEEVLTAAAERLPEVNPNDPREPETQPDTPVTEPDAKPTGVPTPEVPEGAMLVDASTLDTLRRQAMAGAAAAEKLRIQDRDAFISSAVKAGKIPPARASHWAAQYDKDEQGTRSFLDSQPAGLIPIVEAGHGGSDDVHAATADAYDMSWLTPQERARISQEA